MTLGAIRLKNGHNEDEHHRAWSLGDGGTSPLVHKKLDVASVPFGSCSHGQILTFRNGISRPKPASDLTVKMGSITMPATQKAL